MALVGALRFAVRMFFPCFCGNRGAVHMDGESTHEAEGIGTEPCILKPQGFPGAMRTPDFALHRCGSWLGRGFRGLAFWVSRTP